jgi:hypothetical protein
MSIVSALSELYLGELQRILPIGTNLDQAQQLQKAHDPGWKQSARAARFALKDELDYFRLIDRACRGLCDCLGIRTRILFETIDKIYARNNPLSPEELRQHHTGDLMMIMMLQKAIIYGISVPDELMRIGSEEKLKEYVDNFIKEGGSQSVNILQK